MPPDTGEADVDFDKQMRRHHVSNRYDQGSARQTARTLKAALATKFISDQEKEIAQIDAWLAKRGQLKSLPSPCGHFPSSRLWFRGWQSEAAQCFSCNCRC